MDGLPVSFESPAPSLTNIVLLAQLPRLELEEDGDKFMPTSKELLYLVPPGKEDHKQSWRRFVPGSWKPPTGASPPLESPATVHLQRASLFLVSAWLSQRQELR